MLKLSTWWFNLRARRNMKPQYFIITRKEALVLGELEFHEWHKREKENILEGVDVKVEYVEPRLKWRTKWKKLWIHRTIKSDLLPTT